MGRSHSNLSQKTTVQPIKGDRAEQREGRHTHSRKNNSEPRKPQYSQQRRPRGAKRRKTHTLKKNQLRAKKTTVQPAKATEGSKEKKDTHTQEKPTQSQENRNTANKGDRGGGGGGGKEERTPKTNPKETTVQPKQRRRSRPSGRETHTFGLGKTEMEGVTNDLTNATISSPMTLGEKAPAPITKTFEKQGQIKVQTTFDTSNEPHGTRRENDSHYVD